MSLYENVTLKKSNIVDLRGILSETDRQLSRILCDRGHSTRSPVASQQAPLWSVHATWKWCMSLS